MKKWSKDFGESVKSKVDNTRTTGSYRIHESSIPWRISLLRWPDWRILFQLPRPANDLHCSTIFTTDLKLRPVNLGNNTFGRDLMRDPSSDYSAPDDRRRVLRLTRWGMNMWESRLRWRPLLTDDPSRGWSMVSFCAVSNSYSIPFSIEGEDVVRYVICLWFLSCHV